MGGNLRAWRLRSLRAAMPQGSSTSFTGSLLPLRPWTKGVGRQPQNRLRSRMKVAPVVDKPRAGIWAHWKWRLTNAWMAGWNSVFRATKRKARSYRFPSHLITRL